MSDEALVDWLNSGAGVVLAPEESLAKRRSDFNLRFLAAIAPFQDLGKTEEEDQLAMAHNVFAVHADLCLLGDEEYNEVWRTLSAPSRAAIKHYIGLAKTTRRRGEG